MFIEHIIAFIAPHHCLGCGAEGAILCSVCACKLPVVPPRCYRCKKVTDDWQTCPACRKVTPLHRVIVATPYSGLAKEAVHAFKFERAKSAAADIARVMAGRSTVQSHNIVMIPVPTASRRIRMRGYDHISLLARELSRRLGVPAYPLLLRHGQMQQMGASRLRRRRQMEGVFQVAMPEVLGEYDEILLVDDVTTTGATLENAAKELRRAGARRVSALVFAQTP